MEALNKSSVPRLRVRDVATEEARADGEYVLYWMTSARRTRYHFGLQRAVEWARALERPLLVLEGLRFDHPWASERIDRFVAEGMVDQHLAFAKRGVAYHAYLEPRAGAARGLLAALVRDACVAVTDDWPCFFHPAMLRAGAELSPVRMEAVDGNGLFPMRAAEKAYLRAVDLRRAMQRELAAHLAAPPKQDPFRGQPLTPHPGIPKRVQKRWPGVFPAGDPTRAELSRCAREAVAARAARRSGPEVAPIAQTGGAAAAGRALRGFVENDLERYGNEKDPLLATSGLSSYLHFGHVAEHQVFAAIASAEAWTSDALGQNGAPRGQREGWWGMSAPAESFLDQLVTWRALGFNMCRFGPDPTRFDTLPDWARASLAKHASDPRPVVYTRERLEAADTEDEIWNAAQRELVRDGRIASYLRMLWGKKVLQWTRTPEEAFEILIDLNNRYAIDGRDPNSYSGIRWIFGAFDRPWGPERDIFGTIRYMTSDSTRRKLRLNDYLERYGRDPGLFGAD